MAVFVHEMKGARKSVGEGLSVYVCVALYIRVYMYCRLVNELTAIFQSKQIKNILRGQIIKGLEMNITVLSELFKKQVSEFLRVRRGLYEQELLTFPE
jgi:hypothetical protein